MKMRLDFMPHFHVSLCPAGHGGLPEPKKKRDAGLRNAGLRRDEMENLFR